MAVDPTGIKLGSMHQAIADSPSSWNRSPLVWLAGLWATLWTLIAIIESAYYIHTPSIPPWQPLTLVLSLTCTVSVWLTFEVRSARYLRFPLEPPGSWFLHHLGRLPILAIGYGVIVFGLRHAIFAMGGARYEHLPWRALVPFELVKASIFYCIWLGLVYGTLSLLKTREQGAKLGLIQKALVEAQLSQLQAQLRPHFLFNTLNTVSSLMQVDVARADRVLTRLGDLLRASLGAGSAMTVPLQQEMNLLRLYADIMQERFSGRVQVDWSLAEGSSVIPVPSMILQPILENAFRYGVEQTTGVETIRVVALRGRDQLVVTIYNTGSTLLAGWREGIGLGNCRGRLRALYGDSATLDLSNHNEGGVIASVSVPITGSTE
jgi:two-component system, LytTR family, sensor kinase